MKNQIVFMLDKKDIRPKLELTAIGKTEGFQNVTLRPILKLQHDIIILVFKNWAVKHKIKLTAMKKDELSKVLDNSFSKNNVVKNQLLGIVIGQFTADEFEEYQIDSSEYNKRIFTMIKKRLFDSFEELKNN
ncbi:glyoxalase [Tenacibaculum sp. MEBiC06402]|uniref:glyoxalase n=1 Tax=unclassified Tenacibaculum TaxID=2635139 RepID=UPI003B9CB350